MGTKKLIGLIVSLVLIAAVAGGIAWAVINFDKVKDGMSGTGLYTQDDIDNAYEDGYQKALENKQEYEDLIDGYRDTITNHNDTIALLNSQITSLNATNNNHLQTISGLQSNISALNVLISEHQTNNAANQNLINGLGAQVTTLQGQVNNLLAQISQNTSTITLLNNRIAELENEVAYYQVLLAAFQSDTRVIATFMINNATYNVQVVNIGATVTVNTPTNTAYFEFLGWTVDGENIINLSNFTLTANTVFVGKVINKYDVKFMYDGAQYANQIIAQNGFASVIPPNDTQYKEFKGWSVDGSTIINLAAYPITAPTTFYGVMDNSYDITFKVLGEVYNQQVVKFGHYAAAPNAPVLAEYNFIGWSVDGITVIDVSAYPVSNALTFFAVVEQKTYSVSFVSNGATVKTQTVNHGSNAAAPNAPQAPNANLVFAGWTVDGNVVSVGSYAVTSNTAFVAKFVYDGVYMLTFSDAWLTDPSVITFVIENNVIKSITMAMSAEYIPGFGAAMQNDAIIDNRTFSNLNLAITSAPQTFEQSYTAKSGNALFPANWTNGTAWTNNAHFVLTYSNGQISISYQASFANYVTIDYSTDRYTQTLTKIA